MSVDNRQGQKRLHSSSTEESDSSFSETCASKPDKKRVNFETDSDTMELQDLRESLVRIEKRLDTMATKIDVLDVRDEIKNLKETFSHKMEELEGRVFETEVKVDKMQADLQAEKKKSESLREAVKQQDRQLKEHQTSLNDLQQYSRRWNLRVYRVPEAAGEKEEDCVRKVCAVFTDAVGVTTKAADIEVAHRTGRPSSDKPRPILVRFFDRKKRDSVLANRRKLKNKGTVIDEDLTHANYQLSARAFKHSATLSVWSNNGRVLARLKNGHIIRLNIHMDLDVTFKRALTAHAVSDEEK